MAEDKTTITTDDMPNAMEEPLLAAYLMLHKVRGDMNGDLYDEHEEVREWAMDVEWAYTAIDEHEDFDTEEIRQILAGEE